MKTLSAAPIPKPHLHQIVDLLHDELSFTLGISAAYQGVQTVNQLADTGLDELIEAHIARLRAIIEKVEAVRGVS